jgi:hypothetical protein
LRAGAALGGSGEQPVGEKMGKMVSFVKFMMYAFPFWLAFIVVSNIYIWLRYFALLEKLSGSPNVELPFSFGYVRRAYLEMGSDVFLLMPVFGHFQKFEVIDFSHF